MRNFSVNFSFFLDSLKDLAYIIGTLRRGVEQLAARRAHNPEAAGSSPAPAITDHSEMSGFLFFK